MRWPMWVHDVTRTTKTTSDKCVAEGTLAMTLPDIDTIITYPSGQTHCQSTVKHVEHLSNGQLAVLLDRTSAHPVDTAWPDQPADHALLHSVEGQMPVIDVVTGGIHDGRLYLGHDLPVRTGTIDWTFVVAHIVEGPPPAIGTRLKVDVDHDRRTALNAGHTACHLAALALDEALRDQWTKPTPLDALGNPSFDAVAIQSSRITPNRSRDVYRLGKSLRRKGLSRNAFDNPDRIASHVNQRLAQWISAAAPARINTDNDFLSGRRYWECDLPDGRVSIPCGGTHVSNTRELRETNIAFEIINIERALEVIMTTIVNGEPRL